MDTRAQFRMLFTSFFATLNWMRLKTIDTVIIVAIRKSFWNAAAAAATNKKNMTSNFSSRISYHTHTHTNIPAAIFYVLSCWVCVVVFFRLLSHWSLICSAWVFFGFVVIVMRICFLSFLSIYFMKFDVISRTNKNRAIDVYQHVNSDFLRP